MPELITQLQQAGRLDALDVALADLMRRLEPEADDRVALAAALTSAALREGHIFLDLAEAAAKPLLMDEHVIASPSLSQWLAALDQSELVGAPGVQSPLILQGNRLHLRRYWQAEEQLAKRIAARVGDNDAGCELSELQLIAIETGLGFKLSDSQSVAVKNAVRQRTVIITGGPGTGKTTVAAAILAGVLLADPPAHGGIALTAPTGRAAQRLAESFSAAGEGLLSQLPQDRQALWPQTQNAQTLHRLLAIPPMQSISRYSAESPLPHSIVVVDEASMVDLELMLNLFIALRDDARLIILGDPHQLSSVQAGAVLAEMTNMSDEVPVSTLQETYRFGEQGPIAKLAQAVRSGDSERALTLFGDDDALRWSLESVRQDRALDEYLALYSKAAGQSALVCFEALQQYRWLCVHRHGQHGALGFGEWLHSQLTPRLRMQGLPAEQGMPIVVTENRTDLGLSNGDIGIYWYAANGALEVHFPALDIAPLSPKRLPQTLIAHAMTVHRSQGSEFQRVGLLLPPADSPLLSREMLYTAITRAKESIAIWGEQSALQIAINTRQRRYSGLAEKLQHG